MKNGQLIVSTAISGLLALGALGLASGAAVASDADKVKCYGVAKAGQNGCAANGHACQGQATVDNDPGEWKYTSQAECDAEGGTTTPVQQAG